MNLFPREVGMCILIKFYIDFLKKVTTANFPKNVKLYVKHFKKIPKNKISIFVLSNLFLFQKKKLFLNIIFSP